MKAIIIEDEKLSSEHLVNLLKKIDRQIQIAGTYDSVKTALTAFENGIEADLLFMDIHIADGLSFELFSKVEIKAPVIFTTAYDEYAIKAFKFNSIDYLLKPIGLTDLKAALDKYHRLNNPANVTLIKDLANVYEAMSKQYKTRFMVKMGETIVSVKTEDISHFVAEDGIVLLATKTEKRYPVDYTLEQLDSFVDPRNFFRINRKVLVNINSISKISTYFNSRLKIAGMNLNDDDCIVSRERVSEFKQWLDG